MLRRKNGLSKIRLLIAILFFYLSIILSPIPISLSDSCVSAPRFSSQSYMAHDPINIIDDRELAAVATSGTGTPNDPYIIADWIITGSPTVGIYITGTTKHFRIENCLVSDCKSGIVADNVTSGTLTLSNNTCINNPAYGIELHYSPSSIVTNNICNNNRLGITLDASDSSIIANNICNNNSFYGITTSYVSNFLVLTNNTCTSNDWAGIYLDTLSSTITNNICNDNGEDGITLRWSSSSTLTNNTCQGNTYNGIRLYYSDSLTITNNSCKSNNRTGIILYLSDSSTVVNNTCASNDYSGICLGYSGSLTVANNTCHSNNGTGIILDHSNSSTVANNTCHGNNEDGLSLEGSDNNSIVWNALVGNGAYGIQLSNGSDNNSVHHNTFIENGQKNLIQSQACDNGTNNQWYDETVLEGNYWSDYSGTGSYFIAGSAGAVDPYPSLPSVIAQKLAFNRFFSLLGRIGLFLVVIGLLGVVLFVNRRQKSS